MTLGALTLLIFTILLMVASQSQLERLILFLCGIGLAYLLFPSS